MTKTWIIGALAALVAACSGSGGRITKSFTYGAATSSLTADEQSAATSASDMAATAQFRAGTSTGDADASIGASVAVLPESMSTALDTAVLGMRAQAAGEAGVQRQVAVASAQMVAATTDVATLSSGCWTATATSITYSNCSATISDSTGSVTGTLNGHITKVGASEVTWDITATVQLSGSISATASDHLTGDLTWTATSLKGFAEADKSATASNGTQTVTAAWTNSIDVNVTFDGVPACIVSGSLELKRIWSNRGGADPNADPMLQDRALKFEWQGACGSVTVSHSV